MIGEPKVTVTILSNDCVAPPPGMPILGEHGFSALIEVAGERRPYRLLLDTGFTGEVVLHNADLLGVDLYNIDFIVLSHRHYDHTGGLPALMNRVKKDAVVVAHPAVLKPCFSRKPRLRIIGMPREARMAVEDRLLLSPQPLELVPGVFFLGEVRRSNKVEKCEGFLTASEGGLTPDEMLDDTGVAINIGDGALLVTGCSHSGVVNMAEWALEVTGASRLLGVIGGFHLVGASDDRIAWTCKQLTSFSPRILAPMHCTGFKATMALMKAAPSSFRMAGSGTILTVGGGNLD